MPEETKPKSIFDILAEDEEFVEAFVRQALANPDGQDAARVQARLVAKEFGLDGDDSGQICNKLDDKNEV